MEDDKPAVAFHGGCSWDYSGLDFERRDQLVIADVLDAPFPPSPKALSALSSSKTRRLESLCRESPPTNSEPLLEVIASVRNLSKRHLMVSSGSSSLLFSIVPRILPTNHAKVLLLQPTYSEYPHILQHVLKCSVMDTIQIDAKTFGHLKGRQMLLATVAVAS